MAESNQPRHGEPIIKVVSSAIGDKKLVASFQFQRFLDELGELLVLTNTDEGQLIFSLVTRINGQDSALAVTASELSDLINWVSALDTENKQLRSVIENHVNSFEELEQSFYGKV